MPDCDYLAQAWLGDDKNSEAAVQTLYAADAAKRQPEPADGGRRRHWLLQETRFLFLTRKGPVEIILKPSLIIGAGFVGVVGMTVIGAVTLFVGFKSVEVVRNESITAAIASAPPTLDEPTDRIATRMPCDGAARPDR